MLNWKRFSTLVLLLALGISAPLLPRNAWAATQNSWITVAEAEVLGGYSKIENHQGTVSGIGSWLVSPTLKITDRLYWINLYNGFFNRSAQVIAQEEGGRRATTTQSHSLSTSLKYNVTDSWSLRPLFFSEWNFVNETKDESFGEGLYDYDDIGGGIESSWATLQTADRNSETRLGFRYLSRTYPNYQSLLSLFDPNGSLEQDEKDLHGYKVNLSRGSLSKNGWSWDVEGIFFYKDYTDKKTIDFNGIRSTSDTRQDFVEYLNVDASHLLSKEWSFRLDGQLAYNQSNLDFYDTHNTLALADDNFIKNYFDYFSFSVKPSLTYTKNLEKDRDFVLSVSYAFYSLHYPGRKAQNALGIYQPDDQQDYTHTFSLRTSYPLTKNIAWVLSGSYLIADSNQKFENFYLYNYDSWTTVTGISLKY